MGKSSTNFFILFFLITFVMGPIGLLAAVAGPTLTPPKPGPATWNITNPIYVTGCSATLVSVSSTGIETYSLHDDPEANIPGISLKMTPSSSTEASSVPLLLFVLDVSGSDGSSWIDAYFYAMGRNVLAPYEYAGRSRAIATAATSVEFYSYPQFLNKYTPPMTGFFFFRTMGTGSPSFQCAGFSTERRVIDPTQAFIIDVPAGDSTRTGNAADLLGGSDSSSKTTSTASSDQSASGCKFLALGTESPAGPNGMTILALILMALQIFGLRKLWAKP